MEATLHSHVWRWVVRTWVGEKYHVATSLVSLAATTQFLLTHYWQWEYLLAVWVGGRIGYVFYRYSDKRDTISLCGKVVDGVWSMFFIFLLFYLSPFLILCLIATGVCVVLYYVRLPWLELRLREVPYLKIFVIAILWGFIALCVMYDHTSVLRPSVEDSTLLYACRTLCFIIAITIPFDVRDIKVDQGKIKTIPTAMGVRKSILLSLGLLCVVVMTDTYLYLDGPYTSYTLVAMMLSNLLAIIIVARMLRVSTPAPSLYYTFWVEGIPIIQIVCIMLGSASSGFF